jgi:hypothetical protein
MMITFYFQQIIDFKKMQNNVEAPKPPPRPPKPLWMHNYANIRRGTKKSVDYGTMPWHVNPRSVYPIPDIARRPLPPTPEKKKRFKKIRKLWRWVLGGVR